MQRQSQQVTSPHRISINYMPSQRTLTALMAHLSFTFSVPPTSPLLRSRHHLTSTMTTCSRRRPLMQSNFLTIYTSNHWTIPLTTSKHTLSNPIPESTPQFNARTHPATPMLSVPNLTRAPKSLAPTSNQYYMTTGHIQPPSHAQCASSVPLVPKKAFTH